MDRVYSNLFINALGIVCLALLLPSWASAQESGRRSRIIRVDREADAVFIRAGADATFERFAGMSRRVLEHPSDVTPQDIREANPGKIIFVCRHDDGTRRLSRNPSTHERCDSDNRSFWLVRGLTYFVPSIETDNRIPDVREEAAALRREVQNLRERLRVQGDSENQRTTESHEVGTRHVEPTVSVSSQEQTTETEASENTPADQGPWYLLMGLLLSMSIMLFYVIFIRHRDKSAWLRVLYSREMSFNEMAQRMHKYSRAYIGTLRRRYRAVIQHRDLQLHLLKEELDETRNLLVEKERELSLLSDKYAQLALKKSAVEDIGVDQRASEEDTRNRQEVDAPADDSTHKSRKADQDALIAKLKAKLLMAETELEHRREAAERIPKLMNAIDRLKPDGFDRLTSQLRMLVSHRNAALRRAGFSDDKANPDRAETLMIQLSYDSLIAKTQEEIETFERSEAGARTRELQQELNELFEEVTGLYGYSASMEASLERDRRAIDRLHAETRGELRAVELLQATLRQKLAETEQKLRRWNEENTQKIRVLPKEPSEIAESPDTAWRLAELEGRAFGQTTRMSEMQEQIRQLMEQINAYEGAFDERMRELRAEVRDLSVQLSESLKREATLLNENRTLHQNSWQEKKVGIFSDPRPPAEERSPSEAKQYVASHSPSPNREGMLRFSDALIRLMDQIDPHLEEGYYLPMDRSGVIDLARLMGYATVENPFQAGDIVPLYILSNYLTLQGGGRLPDRLRSPTIKPPDSRS